MEFQQRQIQNDEFSRNLLSCKDYKSRQFKDKIILLQGLRGLGIELAKNLILEGPQKLILFDDQICTERDRGSNFFIKQKDVGLNSRAFACKLNLSELNKEVKVEVLEGVLSEKCLENLDLVIFTDFYEKQKLIQFNEFCRQRNIGFIYSGILGLYGFGFVDFGENHLVEDENGEKPNICYIGEITKEKEAMVTVYEGEKERHRFYDNDFIQIKEVNGMDQINDKIYQIKVKSPHEFIINCDSSEFGNYLNGGYAEEVKMKKKISFKSFQKSLVNPFLDEIQQILPSLDGQKKGISDQLHLFFNSLLDFVEQNGGKLPELGSQKDSEKLLEMTLKLNEKYKENQKEDQISEQLIKNISFYADTNLAPFSSFWGGIISNEAMKITGQLTPFRQWIHYEALEVLPENKIDKIKNELNLNSRYFDMSFVFGEELLEQFKKQNVLLTGAGSIGCEFIKLFSLLGICCSQQGVLLVSDEDLIKQSGLKSQFLYREKDINKKRSQIITEAAKKINEETNIQTTEKKIIPENQDFFDSQFWSEINFVVNAVSSFKERIDIDNYCVWNSKILFDSGIVGTKGHTQVILPNTTQSYSETNDVYEEQFPLCTLKYYPHKVEHAIQWAREQFEFQFVESYQDLSMFLDSKENFIQKLKLNLEENRKSGMLGKLRNKLQNVKQLFPIYQKGDFEECINLSRNLFQELYHNFIAQVQFDLPFDLTTKNGSAFWTGTKRYPQVLEFDYDNSLHLEFIQSSSNIYASMLNIKKCDDLKKIKDLVNKIVVIPFKPKSKRIRINENDNTQDKAEDNEQICEQLILEIEKLQFEEKNTLNEVKFDLENSQNDHFNFILAVSNLRTKNYNLKESNQFLIKEVAGKIIPTYSSTASLVAGALGLEIIKNIQKKKITQMKNLFFNLALPLVLFTQPLDVFQNKDLEFDPITLNKSVAIPPNWTRWDKIVVKGPLTLQQFLEYFKQNYKIQIETLYYLQYSFYSSSIKYSNEQINLEIKTFIEQYTEKIIPQYLNFLPIQIGINFIIGDEDVQAQMPIIKYEFK